jgi:hypothetical protein
MTCRDSRDLLPKMSIRYNITFSEGCSLLSQKSKLTQHKLQDIKVMTTYVKSNMFRVNHTQSAIKVKRFPLVDQSPSNKNGIFSNIEKKDRIPEVQSRSCINTRQEEMIPHSRQVGNRISFLMFPTS